MKLDVMFTSNAPDHGIGRDSFVEAWKEIGSRAEGADPKITFGLLDFDGENRIYQDRMLVLCDALPRRAEFFALGNLAAHLQKTYGSLEDAYAALADINPVVEDKPKKEKEDKRRLSVAF
ncbi:unnamed protein product [Effrenium voratum]|nr:unnamed protein product [Effrenium voratum]